MTARRIRRMTVSFIFLPWISFAAERGVGIIKGTIMIEGKPTPDAVVSVEGLPKKERFSQPAGVEQRKAVIEQKELRFTPRVVAVLVGTAVDFPNNDSAWHNVFSASATKKFDLGLYPPGKTRGTTFDRPGIVRALCNVHPNMEAFVVVKEHPYFSVSDSRGNYRIDAVPLGNYRLEIWHPEAGTKVQPLRLVREGEVLAIDVDLKRQR